MSARNTVAPSTLGVTLSEDGIAVEYLDGREVFYHGPPRKAAGTVRTAPGKLVQILVTDPDGTEGVLTYLNDHNTHDDILETTGVGRVFVDPGETAELFPGVTARAEGHAVTVEADPEVARGRVFVFAEDELEEQAYEIVAENQAEPTADDADADPSGDSEAESAGGPAADRENDVGAGPRDAGVGDRDAASEGGDADWIDSEYVEDE